jgi:hypothetical protein
MLDKIVSLVINAGQQHTRHTFWSRGKSLDKDERGFLFTRLYDLIFGFRLLSFRTVLRSSMLLTGTVAIQTFMPFFKKHVLIKGSIDQINQ